MRKKISSRVSAPASRFLRISSSARIRSRPRSGGPGVGLQVQHGNLRRAAQAEGEHYGADAAADVELRATHLLPAVAEALRHAQAHGGAQPRRIHLAAVGVAGGDQVPAAGGRGGGGGGWVWTGGGGGGEGGPAVLSDGAISRPAARPGCGRAAQWRCR